MVAVSDVFYEEQSVEDERLERIVSIMNSLPTMQQTIVRLRHMEGMEMRQIAELTGSSEVAVRKALSRARKAIKEQFLNHKNWSEMENINDIKRLIERFLEGDTSLQEEKTLYDYFRNANLKHVS